MNELSGFDVEKEDAIPTAKRDMLFSVSDSSSVTNIEDNRLANSVILEKILMKISKDVDDELVIVKKNSDAHFFQFFLLWILGVVGSFIYGNVVGWDRDFLFICTLAGLFLVLPLNLFYMLTRKGFWGDYNYSHSRLLRVNFNNSLRLVSSSVCKGDLDEPGHLLRLTMILANNEHLRIDPAILLEKIKKDIHRRMTAKLNSDKKKKLSNESVLKIRKDVVKRYYDLMCGLYVRRLNVQGREDVKYIRSVITEIKELNSVPVYSRDEVLKMEADKFIEESLGGDFVEFNRKVLSNFNEGGYK